jgi:hypothetical protein
MFARESIDEIDSSARPAFPSGVLEIGVYLDNGVSGGVHQ